MLSRTKVLLEVQSGTQSGDTIYGKGGDDDISGLGGGDRLFGNKGNDTEEGVMAPPFDERWTLCAVHCAASLE